MITKEQIQEATKRLVEVYQPEAIYLFGSYAWGEPTEDSDIDLMIVVEDAHNSEFSFIIKGNKALAGIGFPIDFLINSTNDFDMRARHRSNLEFLVKEKGVKLYESA
jgi:uncharacterized protein